MKEVTPLAVLKSVVEQYPTQRAAADALGIHPVYLCDLLRGHRGFGELMLKRLGLKQIVVKA
jgi:hypothetical protein